MTAEQWRRTRELFERALDENPPDLHAWLAREAADDSAVRAEVASLLEHHTRAGEFLSQPAGGRLDDLLREEPRFASGYTVGPYVIVREIGRGGMGRVYMATDSRLGRTVAIKALPAELAGRPLQRERLRREAQAAAALRHPGICTIYALEELDGELFIVSELVEGQTLREEIRSGNRPSASQLLATARELALALASAHQRGVTHRDLKPENVMRATDGHLKILDFGLAILDPGSIDGIARANLTQPGTVVGTPAYMAPEQLNGGTADPRTDVFSYGVLLYEYATGIHPFDAPSPLARVARVLESEPTPLSHLRPDLSDTVTSVIGKALRKAPADRYASAAAIVDRLAREEKPGGNSGVAGWWRTHQVSAIALYFFAAALAWQIKEWQHGPSDALFLCVGVAAAVAGIFRGHLLFTERMNRVSFGAERRRAEPVTFVVDVLIALALAANGLMLTRVRPLVGVLTIALAVCIAIARVVVERATATAAFGETP
ncbi:MAG: protein kinase [Luteitalea sp.]|nr:protein kinase [Luteitalea sp.]